MLLCSDQNQPGYAARRTAATSCAVKRGRGKGGTRPALDSCFVKDAGTTCLRSFPAYLLCQRPAALSSPFFLPCDKGSGPLGYFPLQAQRSGSVSSLGRRACRLPAAPGTFEGVSHLAVGGLSGTLEDGSGRFHQCGTI